MFELAYSMPRQVLWQQRKGDGGHIRTVSFNHLARCNTNLASIIADMVLERLVTWRPMGTRKYYWCLTGPGRM